MSEGGDVVNGGIGFIGNHRVGQLSNGIRVVVENRPASEVVAFYFLVGVGSRDEDDEVVGVSHALEHMIFKGTPSRNAMDIAREMEGNGATINAFTGVERTGYWFLAPAVRFQEVLRVYADSLHYSLLAHEEWEKERQVILEEKRMYEENNAACAPVVLLPEAMFNLQMGIIGSENTIRRIGPEDMRALIKKWYLPENIVISIAGGITFDEALSAAEKALGNFGQSWQVGSGLMSRCFLPYQSKTRYIERVGRFDQTTIAAGFRIGGYHSPYRHAARILADILGGKMSSRLFSEVREKRALAYRVRSSTDEFRDAGVFNIMTMTTKPVEAFKVIMVEVEKMAREPVSDQELVDSKFLLNAADMKMESAGGFAAKNGSNVLRYGRMVNREEEERQVAGVTKDDVLGVAYSLLSLGQLTVALTGPESLEKEIALFLN
ncbi:MAG: insulinase family protein [Candidatus Niyogibacteria bacterium]|nr:MAG: insulinase family protein [Candidatus Niyogibacteria bacterium]